MPLGLRADRWTILATLPWIVLADGCSCPTSNRQMKLTPAGVAAIAPAHEGDKLTSEQCAALCEGHAIDPKQPGGVARYWRCELENDGPDTYVWCSGTMPCIGGRRPDGADLGPDVDEHAYFAGLAALEAASVVAFLDLAEALDAHGAPRSLVERALRSAGEEIRHARLAALLARARDERPSIVEIRRTETPDLEALAIDNAREGMVREAFGALVALHQAKHAEDADVRDAMRRIARDELAHARLAKDIDAWATGRLRARERRRVVEARDVARAGVVASAGHEPSRARRASIGWPDAERAVAIARSV